MRIGIEIEYWTVDRDGNLAHAPTLPAAFEGVEREFVEPLIEVRTPPCDSVAELTAQLRRRLERILEAARERDRRLVPLGTPLGTERPAIRSTPRVAVQRAILGDALSHAAHCAGTHVHFEQESPADQLRVLPALDPAFALVNTSPYYRGRRVRACARPYAYRRLCYDALPTHGRLWRYPDSVAAWRERLEERFEAFVDAAEDAGIERDEVERHFSPADAVWTPVRLRDDLGTVEWRAPDAGPPDELLRLVADVTEVVDAATERGTRIADEPGIGETVRLPPFADLRDRVETALADGLATPPTRRYLERLGLRPDAYRPIGPRIDGRDRLDAERVRRLRLRAADRLERAVDRLARDEADPDAATVETPAA